MTAAVHTPITTDLASAIGPRLYRKQVLPIGSIDYKGRKLDFTREYLGSLVESFKDRAYDSVKFLLAPADNSHTLDPERARGTVKGFELTADGLDMLLEPTDEGAKVLDEHPDLGVSARIVEGLARADGKSFPRAIQHVLGTFDPRVTGMRPWEAVNLSTEDQSLTVVDLSAESFTDPEGAVMAEITDDQKAILDDIAKLSPEKRAALFADEPAGKGEDGKGEDEPSEKEIADALAALEADANAEQTAGASLSAEAQAAIDLANASADEANQRTIDLATALAASQWQTERQAYLTAGVPAAMLAAADPILSLPAGAIELSNSEAPDPVAALRAVIDAAKGIVDLSVVGEVPEPADERKEREERARAYAKNHGIR